MLIPGVTSTKEEMKAIDEGRGESLAGGSKSGKK